MIPCIHLCFASCFSCCGGYDIFSYQSSVLFDKRFSQITNTKAQPFNTKRVQTRIYAMRPLMSTERLKEHYVDRYSGSRGLLCDLK